jgi:hypothetical protein
MNVGQLLAVPQEIVELERLTNDQPLHPNHVNILLLERHGRSELRIYELHRSTPE